CFEQALVHCFMHYCCPPRRSLSRSLSESPRQNWSTPQKVQTALHGRQRASADESALAAPSQTYPYTLTYQFSTFYHPYVFPSLSALSGFSLVKAYHGASCAWLSAI